MACYTHLYDKMLKFDQARIARNFNISFHDYLLVDKSAVATRKLRDLKEELLINSFDSPDLALTNTPLFPDQNTIWVVKNFGSNEEIAQKNKCMLELKNSLSQSGDMWRYVFRNLNLLLEWICWIIAITWNQICWVTIYQY